MIYTGGTIGMKQDPVEQTLKPFDFHQILGEVPELNKFALRIDSYTFDPLIDSSDVEPSFWQSLALLIQQRYDEYDGFVVLHGTDTMAYSASALSFMLENLAKPVVFTGSQLPIGVPRTDGKENLISAVEIASAKDKDGHPRVPEVSIFFNSKLLRGNRCVKVSSEDFSAFTSPNCPPLAEAGISIRYNDGIIRRPTVWDEPLRISKNLDTRVSILKVHPGITPQVMKYFLCGPDIRAAIIETYGSGNAPSRQWFLDIVKEASEAGKSFQRDTVPVRHRQHGHLRHRQGPGESRGGLRNGHHDRKRPREAVLPYGENHGQRAGQGQFGRQLARRNFPIIIANWK